MSFLDLKTILLINVLLSFISTLIFISLWLNARRVFKGISLWFIGMGLQAAGSLLIVLRGNISDLFSIVMANVLILSGILIFYIGFRKFMGRPGSQVHNYVLIIASGIFFYYFTFINSNLPGRTIVLAAVFLALALQWAWFSLISLKGDLRKSSFGIGIIFLIYAFVNTIRIITNLPNVALPTNNNFFASGQFDILIVLTYSLLILFLAYDLILAVNGRLANETVFQEEKFQKAFQVAPYGVVITRFTDGRIVEANKAWLAIPSKKL